MRANSGLGTTWGMIAALAVVVAAGGQDRQAAARPTARAALDDDIDKILTRLEHREIHDLRANVEWRTKSPYERDEDAKVKKGEIWFMKFEPVAKFLVVFDQRISAGRVHKVEEKHLFDGRWYVEVLGPPSKTVSRNEIRRENDPANPYKIGEGPFPLPFGQKKADILAEFVVERGESGDDDRFKDADHLKLTPRKGTRSAKKYEWIEFWLAKESGLPIQMKTAKKAPTGRLDAFITITFTNVKSNTSFSKNVFKIETPTGYFEQVDRLPPLPAP